MNPRRRHQRFLKSSIGLVCLIAASACGNLSPDDGGSNARCGDIDRVSFALAALTPEDFAQRAAAFANSAVGDSATVAVSEAEPAGIALRFADQRPVAEVAFESVRESKDVSQDDQVADFWKAELRLSDPENDYELVSAFRRAFDAQPLSSGKCRASSGALLTWSGGTVTADELIRRRRGEAAPGLDPGEAKKPWAGGYGWEDYEAAIEADPRPETRHVYREVLRSVLPAGEADPYGDRSRDTAVRVSEEDGRGARELREASEGRWDEAPGESAVLVPPPPADPLAGFSSLYAVVDSVTLENMVGLKAAAVTVTIEQGSTNETLRAVAGGPVTGDIVLLYDQAVLIALDQPAMLSITVRGRRVKLFDLVELARGKAPPETRAGADVVFYPPPK